MGQRFAAREVLGWAVAKNMFPRKMVTPWAVVPKMLDVSSLQIPDKLSRSQSSLSFPVPQLRKSRFLFSRGGKAPSGETETTEQSSAQPGRLFRHEIIRRFPTHILIKNSAMQIAR